MNTCQGKPSETTTCRCCGQAVTVKPWGINGRDCSVLTCENTDCDLDGYTFGLSAYAETDLTPYAKEANNDEQ